MVERYEGFLYAAYKDAIAADALSSDLNLHSEAIAFHAQQAAEKMLKNVFEIHEQRPEFTHDIGRLMKVALDEGWLTAEEAQVRVVVSLAKFAVAARYETAPEITGAEALEAIAACNVLAALLEDNGLPSVRINSKASFLRSEVVETAALSDNAKAVCGKAEDSPHTR